MLPQANEAHGTGFTAALLAESVLLDTDMDSMSASDMHVASSYGSDMSSTLFGSYKDHQQRMMRPHIPLGSLLPGQHNWPAANSGITFNGAGSGAVGANAPSNTSSILGSQLNGHSGPHGTATGTTVTDAAAAGTGSQLQPHQAPGKDAPAASDIQGLTAIDAAVVSDTAADMTASNGAARLTGWASIAAKDPKPGAVANAASTTRSGTICYFYGQIHEPICLF